MHVIAALEAHRPRGLHRRDRLRQPARRPGAQRRDPHLRGPRRPPLARRRRRHRRRLRPAGRARGMPRQGPPADRRDRRQHRGPTPSLRRRLRHAARERAAGPGAGRLRDAAWRERTWTRTSRGSRQRARALRRGRCRRSTSRRRDGAVRIDYVPGQPRHGHDRARSRRARCRSCSRPYIAPRRPGRAQVARPRLLDALSQDGTTPLLLDADGTVLEAAWASVLIRRDGALYTPREDGRILPSTSRPDASQADLQLAARRRAARQLRRWRDSCRPCSREPAGHRAPVRLVLRAELA